MSRLQGTGCCHSGRSSGGIRTRNDRVRRRGPATQRGAWSKHLNLRLKHSLYWLGVCILPAQNVHQVGPIGTVLGCRNSVILVESRGPRHRLSLLEVSHDLLPRASAAVVSHRSSLCHSLHELLMVIAGLHLLGCVRVALLHLALQAYDIDLEESHSVANLFLQLSGSGSLVL